MQSERKVSRGGAWYDIPKHAGVPLRSRGYPDSRNTVVGIRLARDPIHTLAREAATNE